jgi:hypothetical protein
MCRVAIAETLLSGAQFLALDEVTTGLDAAVAFEVMQNLKHWADLTHGTIIAALQQPTPEVYELFDDVILLREGVEVYHGSRAALPDFLAQQGWVPPSPIEGDIADWLVDLLSDPAKLHEIQAHRVSHLVAHHPGLQQQLGLQGLVSTSESESESSDDEKEDAATPSGVIAAPLQPVDQPAAEPLLLNPYLKMHGPVPALTTEAMQAHWRGSEGYKSQCTRDKRTMAPLQLSTPYAVAQYGQAYGRSMLALSWLIFARQTKLTLRNRMLLFSLPVAGVITALILGSLFWQLKIDDFANRLGCLFYTLVHLGKMPPPLLHIHTETSYIYMFKKQLSKCAGFNGNAEIASIMAIRPVVYRQAAANMYPAALSC